MGLSGPKTFDPGGAVGRRARRNRRPPRSHLHCKIPTSIECQRKAAHGHLYEGDNVFSASKSSTRVLHLANDNCVRSTDLLLDTGAAKSVVGLRQARRFAKLAGERLTLAPSKRRFRFGIDVHASLGSTTLRFPTPGGISSITVDVVKPDLPFLVGLDVLDAKRLQVLSVRNLIEHVPPSDMGPPGWTMPLWRKNGHIFLRVQPLPPPSAVFYSRRQLHALHRNLYHPSPAKLFELLRRADPESLPPETLDVLQQISRACVACQRFSPAPMRFKVTIPGSAVFNRRVKLDLMFEQGKSILHVVDDGTNMNAAGVLKRQDVGSVWNSFVSIWSRVYLGDPSEMQCDQGSVFTSHDWKALCDSHDIQLQLNPTEQHNSLGSGETYHHPLRRVLRKLTFENPQVEFEVLLQIAVYAINTSANPYGLIPCLLVFGSLPRVPFFPATDPKTTSERMATIDTARAEYYSA